MQSNQYYQKPLVEQYAYIPLAQIPLCCLQGFAFFLSLTYWKGALVLLVVGLLSLFLQDEIKLCKLYKQFKVALINAYLISIIAAAFIGFYFNSVFSPLHLIVLYIFDLTWAFYVYKNYKLAYFEANEKAL